jgi:hypothetical protein
VPFAHVAAARLEELRLMALERRLEAELDLGRHVEAVGELAALVAEHPFRERLCAQLMVALYRSGRQAEALGAYQAARRALVDGLGIEPGPPLRALEKAILRHDPSLDGAVAAQPERAILVAALDEEALAPLTALAAVLARRPPHELILVRPVAPGVDLAAATALVTRRREALLREGIAARAAAFTSSAPARELARIAAPYDVDLVLVDGEPDALADVGLEELPCDAAVLVVRPEPFAPGIVLVPFSGSEHDWAAVELGAWAARASGSPLRLAGADANGGRDDASRLLAHASLALQRGLGVVSEVVLVSPTSDALVDAAADAALLVLGLPERWRRDGLGPARLDLVRRAVPPSLLVRRGPRPGGLAPRESLTRFTWSVG